MVCRWMQTFNKYTEAAIRIQAANTGMKARAQHNVVAIIWRVPQSIVEQYCTTGVYML